MRSSNQDRIDGAVPPGFGHLGHVDVEVGLGAEQRDALGVCLHHSVLDAVVDHLGVK